MKFIHVLLLSTFLSFSACDTGESISDGLGCRLNSDCEPGSACVEGSCLLDTSACSGPQCPCLSEGDCGPGQGCETETGACFDLECLTDSGCSLGDVCFSGLCVTDVEADRDRDGVPDNEDSCPEVANSEQEDNDADGRGDACDDDDDNDAVPDPLDNCPLEANPVQGDADGNGLGNACDKDAEGIDLVGVLDHSALQADVSNAEVFLGGSAQSVGINNAGRFLVEDALAEPGPFTVRVEWPGFVSVVQEHIAPDRQELFQVPTIVLRPVTGEAEGGVSLSAQALLEGALTHEEILVQARVGGELVDTSFTGEDGAFILNLAPIDHQLRLTRRGYEALEVTAVFNTQGPNAGAFSVDGIPIGEAALVLSAVPAALVRGKITSPLNPEDWPSRAFVTIVGSDESLRRIAPVVTQLEDGVNKGAFEFAGLPVGDYTIFVSARGHLPAQREVGADLLADLVEEVPEISLEREATAVLLRGSARLLDLSEDGDHSGVIIRATIEGEPVATGVTDTNGDFAFQSSEEDHRLTLSKDGYEEQVVDLEYDTQQSRFELGGLPFDDPASRVSLRPLATFSVLGRLDSTLENVNDWPSRAFVSLISADEQTRRIEPVLPDGSFQFNGLRPGEYNLSISARGHVSVLSLPINLVDADEELGTIILTAEALDNENATLMRGVVLLADAGQGGDNSGITVRGRDGGNLVFTTTTDETGTFVAVVSKVRHVLTFSKTGYISSGESTVEFIEGEEDEDPGSFEFEGRPLETETFTLEPRQTAALQGTLTSPLVIDNWPERSLVVVIGQNNQRVATVSNEEGDGRFDLSGLRSGPLTLSVQVQGHLPITQELTLPIEGLDLGAIALTPVRVGFTGQTVDGLGEALEGVIVRAKRGVNTADIGISDDQGRFDLDLTPELHTLSFTRDGFRPHPLVTLRWNTEAFDVESDQEGEPPFKLRALPVASFSGEVASEEGARNDWPNIAFVTLLSESERRIEPVANSDAGRGQFQFAGLTAGRYTFSVTAQGHQPFSQEVTLVEGENTTASVPEIGQAVLTLTPQAQDEEQSLVMQGRVLLEGEVSHGGILVRAEVADNLVATAVTDTDGAFAFTASRATHTLTFSKEGFTDPSNGARVVFDELDDRFEFNGDALSSETALTTMEAIDGGVITVGVDMAPQWIPSGQRTVLVTLLGPNVARTASVVASVEGQEGTPVSFENLRPGQFVVAVQRDGFARDEQTITLTSQAMTADVELSLPLTDLGDADLELEGVALSSADLRALESLQGADLSGVILRDSGAPADLSCLNFGSVDFSGADLVGASLTGAKLSFADFTGADMAGAALHPRTLDTAIHFPDFAGAGDLQLNGVASIQGRAMRLTPTRDNSAGTAYHTKKQQVAAGFETTFSFRISELETEGASGFAFVIQNRFLSSLGGSGGGLGFSGIRNSLAVEFDMAGDDPDDNHISVQSLGTAANSSRIEARIGEAFSTADGLPDMSDGLVHEVRLSYEPGTLAIYFDDFEAPVLTIDVDLDDLLNLDAGEAFVGFSAATGDLHQRHDILSWSFGAAVPPCARGIRRTLLNGTRFLGANLEGAVLTDPMARRAPSCSAPSGPPLELEGTSFTEANLRGASMSGLDLRSAVFSNAQMSSLHAQRSCMVGIELNSADLSGINLDGANLAGASLAGALLGPAEATFGLTRDIFATARGADMRDINLASAVIEAADLTGATLSGANLNGANIAGVDMSGVDAAEATFLDAVIGSAAFKAQAPPEGCVLPTETGLLLGEWSFEGDTIDSSGRGHHGIATNLEYGLGIRGSAGVFNNNAFVNIDAIAEKLNTGDGFTLTAFFRTAATPANDLVNIIFSTSLEDGETSLTRVSTGNTGGIFVNPGCSNCGREEGGPFNQDSWHHLRVSVAADGTSSVSVDGRRIFGFTNHQTEWSDAVHFSIGQEYNPGLVPAKHFNGLIDEVRILTGCTEDRFDECLASELPLSCRVKPTVLADGIFDRANMPGVVFNGVDLSRTSFRQTNLLGASFAEAKFSRTSFRGADLRRADFSAEVMRDSDMLGANLEQVSFSGAELQDTIFGDCTYAGQCSFTTRDDCIPQDCTPARLAGADFSSATLLTVNFIKADLQGSRWGGVRLFTADFSGADLLRADFTATQWAAAPLVGARAEQADFKRSVFTATDMFNTRFHDADLSDVVITLSDLDGASFTDGELDSDVFLGDDAPGANLSGAIFEDVSLAGVDFRQATLIGAVFHSQIDIDGARFQRARLDFADLSGVQGNSLTKFVDASMVGVTMDGASIASGDFDGAKLRDASFVGATLTGATFNDCDLRGAVFDNANLVGGQMRRVNLASGSAVGILGGTLDLRSAILTRANFTDAGLAGANLTNVDAPSSSFMGASLFGANMSNSNNLDGAWADANIVGADLTQVSGLTHLCFARANSSTDCPNGNPWSQNTNNCTDCSP